MTKVGCRWQYRIFIHRVYAYMCVDVGAGSVDDTVDYKWWACDLAANSSVCSRWRGFSNSVVQFKLAACECLVMDAIGVCQSWSCFEKSSSYYKPDMGYMALSTLVSGLAIGIVACIFAFVSYSAIFIIIASVSGKRTLIREQGMSTRSTHDTNMSTMLGGISVLLVFVALHIVNADPLSPAYDSFLHVSFL